MAVITGSAAGGNYSATTAWVGGVVPGLGDDVKLDATTGNITFDTSATNLCKTLDCTGYTGTLTLASAQTVTIAGNLIKMVPGMTFTISGTTGTFNFTDTAAETVNITTGGKTFPNVNFGQGSTTSAATWNHTDDYTYTGAITVTCGTWTTNNFNITGGTHVAGGNNTRTLNLGSSTITLNTGGTFPWNWSNSTNTTLNAGTSTIICTNIGSGFQGGNMVYYDVVIQGSGSSPQLAGINTFHNFTRTGTATKTDGMVVNNPQTVTGTLTLTGNSALNRLTVSSFSFVTQTFNVSGAVSLTNVDFKTFNAAGPLIPWTGTKLGNLGTTTGITFTSPRSVYWVGNAGNWDDTTHWSLTSGGAGGAEPPMPQDTAYFDANSFSSASQTVTTNNATMSGMNWTGVTNTPTLASSLTATVYGSLVLSSGMATSGTSTITLTPPSGGVLDVGGLTLSFALTIAGAVQLTSNLALASARTLTHTSGAFDLNNFNITTGLFVANGTSTRSITFGSGTITLASTGTVWNTNVMTGYTVNRGTGTITISNVSATSKTLAFGGGNWPNLVLPASNSGTTIITAASATTFDSATFGKSSTYSFGAGQTFKFKAFNATGSAGQLVTFISNSAGTAAILDFVANGIVSVAYASIKDSNPVQTGTWFAGLNSTAVSNTGNWVFGNGTAAIFTANMGFAADDDKQTNIPLVAGMGLFGAHGKGLLRSFAGSLGFLGGFTKLLIRGMNATLSSISATIQIPHFSKAGLSFVGMLKKRYGKAFTSGVLFSGTLTNTDTYKSVQINSTLSFSQRQVATGEQNELGDILIGDNNYGQLPDLAGQPAGILGINFLKSKGLSFIGQLSMALVPTYPPSSYTRVYYTPKNLQVQMGEN